MRTVKIEDLPQGNVSPTDEVLTINNGDLFRTPVEQVQTDTSQLATQVSLGNVQAQFDQHVANVQSNACTSCVQTLATEDLPVDPVVGTLVFNITTDRLVYYSSSGWRFVGDDSPMSIPDVSSPSSSSVSFSAPSSSSSLSSFSYPDVSSPSSSSSLSSFSYPSISTSSSSVSSLSSSSESSNLSTSYAVTHGVAQRSSDNYQWSIQEFTGIGGSTNTWKGVVVDGLDLYNYFASKTTTPYNIGLSGATDGIETGATDTLIVNVADNYGYGAPSTTSNHAFKYNGTSTLILFEIGTIRTFTPDSTVAVTVDADIPSVSSPSSSSSSSLSDVSSPSSSSSSPFYVGREIEFLVNKTWGNGDFTAQGTVTPITNTNALDQGFFQVNVSGGIRNIGTNQEGSLFALR